MGKWEHGKVRDGYFSFTEEGSLAGQRSDNWSWRESTDLIRLWNVESIWPKVGCMWLKLSIDPTLVFGEIWLGILWLSWMTIFNWPQRSAFHLSLFWMIRCEYFQGYARSYSVIMLVQGSIICGSENHLMCVAFLKFCSRIPQMWVAISQWYPEQSKKKMGWIGALIGENVGCLCSLLHSIRPLCWFPGGNVTFSILSSIIVCPQRLFQGQFYESRAITMDNRETVWAPSQK